MLNAEEYRTWPDAEDEEELGSLLAQQINALLDTHKYRLQKCVKACAAYDNTGYNSSLDASAGKPMDGWLENDSLTFNSLSSSIDTLLSKVGKNKILPRIITTNAKWSKREQASKVEKFIRGLFKQLNVEEAMERALFSSLLHGDGFVKICNQGDKISLEAVLTDEIFVDFVDAMYGQPSAMYQTRLKSIKKVIADFPEHREDLELTYASDAESLMAGSDATMATRDMVVLIEAWSLPQGDCYPGRHVITCGSHVLLDEEWDRDYFPFIHIQFQKPERSFYSKGMYHALAPLQREIDFTFQMISDAQRLCGAPKVFVHSKNIQDPVTIHVDSSISNKVGELVRLTGGDSIEVYSPPALNSERFSYLSQLKQLSYEQVGVSQLSATSRLPIGIDGASGKALREYSDIETERFALLAQEWERCHGQLGEMLIKEVARNPDFLVRSYSRTSPLEEIKYSDLQIRIDDVVISVYPASMLPSRPEARFAQVQEWIQSGFIDKEGAMELMDIPDLDAFAEINNAPKKAVDKLIDMILEHRIKLSVEPFMNLKYLVKQATFYYNYVLAEWNPRKSKTRVVLDLLRETIEDANYQLEQLNKSTAQPAPSPTAGLPVQGTPDLAGLAAGTGAPLPPEVAAPGLPPDATALLGGMYQ
jgi:hypothetical protein